MSALPRSLVLLGVLAVLGGLVSSGSAAACDPPSGIAVAVPAADGGTRIDDDPRVAHLRARIAAIRAEIEALEIELAARRGAPGESPRGALRLEAPRRVQLRSAAPLASPRRIAIGGIASGAPAPTGRVRIETEASEAPAPSGPESGCCACCACCGKAGPARVGAPESRVLLRRTGPESRVLLRRAAPRALQLRAHTLPETGATLHLRALPGSGEVHELRLLLEGDAPVAPECVPGCGVGAPAPIPLEIRERQKVEHPEPFGLRTSEQQRIIVVPTAVGVPDATPRRVERILIPSSGSGGEPNYY